MTNIGMGAILAFGLMTLTACDNGKGPTRASQSAYERSIRGATTSANLTNADLAWHAQNTFGWDCAEVVTRGSLGADGYFVIECSSGTKLRVYPRAGQHPRITNEHGGMD